jgi:hypothetical protein
MIRIAIVMGTRIRVGRTCVRVRQGHDAHTRICESKDRIDVMTKKDK